MTSLQVSESGGGFDIKTLLKRFQSTSGSPYKSPVKNGNHTVVCQLNPSAT